MSIDTTLQQLGNYRLEQLLGRGGHADVYLAVDTNLGCHVAVKVLRGQLSASESDPTVNVDNHVETTQRFWREWKTVGTLDHPHIVRARFADCSTQHTYLVMDYVSGSNLHDIVNSRGIQPIEQAIQWMQQASSALEYAHLQGIVHRDLKPSNMLVTQNNDIKIVDFGLALMQFDDVYERCTLPGVVMGTADYIAPENIRDAQHADERSDIYSLGCVFYFLLFGQAPFARQHGVSRKLAAHEMIAPEWNWQGRNERPTVRRLATKLLKCMLAKDPDDRPQTVAEVRRELAQLAAASSRPARLQFIQSWRGIAKHRLSVVLSHVGRRPFQWTLAALSCGGIAYVAAHAEHLSHWRRPAWGSPPPPTASAPRDVGNQSSGTIAQADVSNDLPSGGTNEPDNSGHRVGATTEGTQPFDDRGSQRVRNVRAIVLGARDGSKGTWECRGAETAKQLATTLRNTCGFANDGASASHESVTVTTLAADLNRAPVVTNRTVRETVTHILSTMSPDDRLILYYCGPVMIGADGQVYLIPEDVKDVQLSASHPQDWGRRLVPISWLASQIEGHVNHGLFVLDAWVIESPQQQEVLLDDSNFTAFPVGIEVAASCQPTCESYFWPRRNVGLLTHWFQLGLKGSADENGDHNLSLKELADYTCTMADRFRPLIVLERERLGKPTNAPLQSAIRLSRRSLPTPVKGFSTVTRSVAQMVDDVAEIVHDIIMLSKERPAPYPRTNPIVQLSDFIETKADGVTETSSQFQSFRTIGAAALTAKLRAEAGSEYSVVGASDVGQNQYVSVASDNSPDGPFDIFVRTSYFPSDDGQRISVKTRVFDTHQQCELASHCVSIPVNREFHSLLKGSHRVETERDSHPHWDAYKDSNVQVTVKLRQRYSAGTIQYRHASMHRDPLDASRAKFLVTPGEELVLQMRNLTTKHLAAIVYIDGITIDGKMAGMTPETAIRKRFYSILKPAVPTIYAAYRTLDDAHVSHSKEATATTEAIRLVPASASLAQRMHDVSQIGEIRIVIFAAAPAPSSRGAFAFAEGEQSTSQVPVSSYRASGQTPLQVIVFNYDVASESPYVVSR